MMADPLIPWLTEHGLVCHPHTLSGTPISLGSAFQLAGLKLAWRVEIEQGGFGSCLSNEWNNVEG